MRRKIMSVMLSLIMIMTMMPAIGGVAYATASWTNLRWDGNIAKWDAYEGASYIWVILYKDGNYLSAFYSDNLTSSDCTDMFLECGSGSYTFTLTPQIDGVWKDEQISTSSPANNYTAPDVEVLAPTNLRWDGSVAKWDAATNASSYVLNLYKGGTLVAENLNCYSNGYSDYVQEKMEYYGSGAYTFKVKSKGYGKTSDLSSSSPVLNYEKIPVATNIHWVGSTVHWDAVENATSYWGRLYKDSVILYQGYVGNKLYYDFDALLQENGTGNYSFTISAYVDHAFGDESAEVENNYAAHSHAYNNSVVKEVYLKTPATCYSDAVYYKSCDCGQKGSDTDIFENTDSKTAHTPSSDWSYDATSHFKKCSVEACQEELSETREAHQYDNDTDSFCNVCGYQRPGTSLGNSDLDIFLNGKVYTYKYSGKVIKPIAHIYDCKSEAELIENVDYKVTYPSGMKNVGSYTVKIEGLGEYYGTVTKSYSIIPATASVKSLTSGTRKLTVKATAKPSSKGASTYLIYYKQKGTSTWKKTSTTSYYKTIKGLKKGKQYYVKLLAYKKVGSKTYYGYESKTKLSKKIK